MATEVIEPEAIAVEPTFRRISWGAIFAGAVAAVASAALLYALGLAIGLSTVDTSDPGSIKFGGLFSGIWGLVTSLVALLIGGLVAGRAAGAQRRSSGALHGFVMWGLATLGGAWLLVHLVSSLVGGMVAVGKTAVQAGGSVVASAAGKAGGAAQSFGLDADAALGPVNQRLQEQGKPPVTTAQLQAATRDAVQQAAQTGELNRQALVQSIANQTALSPEDADDVANRVEVQYRRFKEQASQALSGVAQKAQKGALKAASATGKALWGVFAALLLGMIAAIVGGLLGVPRTGRRERAPAPVRQRQRAPLTPREA